MGGRAREPQLVMSSSLVDGQHLREKLLQSPPSTLAGESRRSVSEGPRCLDPSPDPHRHARSVQTCVRYRPEPLLDELTAGSCRLFPQL